MIPTIPIIICGNSQAVPEADCCPPPQVVPTCLTLSHESEDGWRTDCWSSRRIFGIQKLTGNPSHWSSQVPTTFPMLADVSRLISIWAALSPTSKSHRSPYLSRTINTIFIANENIDELTTLSVDINYEVLIVLVPKNALVIKA